MSGLLYPDQSQVYNTFFDVAGSEGNRSDVLVAVGVLAEIGSWIPMEQRWNAFLRDWGIARFHMKDFAHFKGPFAAWRDKPIQRAEILSRLIHEGQRGSIAVVVQALDLTTFNQLDAKFQLASRVGSAYSLVMHMGMMRCARILGRIRGPGTALNFCVADGDAGQPGFKRFLEANDGGVIFLKGNDGPEGGYTLLQLADLVAYEYRLAFRAQLDPRRVARKDRGSFAEIRQTIKPYVSVASPQQILGVCGQFAPL